MIHDEDHLRSRLDSSGSDFWAHASRGVWSLRAFPRFSRMSITGLFATWFISSGSRLAISVAGNTAGARSGKLCNLVQKVGRLQAEFCGTRIARDSAMRANHESEKRFGDAGRNGRGRH